MNKIDYIFCIPGREFTKSFLNSWTNTIKWLESNNISWAFVNEYNSVVYYVRNQVLGGDITRGRNQKPYNGKLQYKKLIWIDSDIVWTIEDLKKIMFSSHDIISGCYPTQDGEHFTIVKSLDYSKLSKNGSFEMMKWKDIKKYKSVFEVNYVGFGFVAIKQGVFESLEYPWFRPKWVETSDILEFTSEDVGFCWSVLENGYKIYVDPSIRVGHEKMKIL